MEITIKLTCRAALEYASLYKTIYNSETDFEIGARQPGRVQRVLACSKNERWSG